MAMAPLLALLLLVAPTLGAAYNYTFEGSDWPGLCQSGEYQSPINIITSRTGSAKHQLKLFAKVGSTVTLVNTGHNVNILPDPATNNSLLFDGERYNLLQAHGHAYSEHAWDGLFTPLELHLVHTKASNSSHLLVLSVPLRLDNDGKDNDFLKSWLDLAPTTGNTTVAVSAPLDFYSLVQRPAKKTQKTLYTYPGSLTTPACTQGVTWVVLDDHFGPTVSVAQVVAFETIIAKTADGVPENMRPPQALHGRHVQSFHAML